MKAYIESDRFGMPLNYNFYKAYQGLHEMGYETIPFSSNSELGTASLEDIIIGYVNTVNHYMYDHGIKLPNLDYPDSISEYLGRKIWMSTLSRVNMNPELWPVFIKPVENKQFTGVVVRSPKDLIGCGKAYIVGDSQVYCSEVVDFITEWRVFVRYGRIVGVSQYSGDWRKSIDAALVENCIKDYHDAPAGYSADFGLTRDGRLLLIEINDGYSLGSYGLYYADYTKLLLARWSELTGTVDDFAFM